MNSAFCYWRATGVPSGQSCPQHVCSPRGVSHSLSLGCLLLFNIRTELWTAQEFQTLYRSLLCRELSVRYSVIAFLLPPGMELERRHWPFCVFRQLSIVVATLANLHHRVHAFVKQTLFSGSSNFRCCCCWGCRGFNRVWVKQRRRKSLEILHIKDKIHLLHLK